MSYVCPDCGLEHAHDAPVVEIDPEPAADAAVEIARIEADRDVTVARVGAGVEKAGYDAQLVEMQGRLAGMEEILSRLAPPPPEPVPPPDPVPVPVPVDEPEPGGGAAPAPEPPPVIDEPNPRGKKAKNPWW